MDASFSGRRILVVEDEYLIAMLLEDMLVELGCTVAGSAATKADALALISAGDFDTAVLDVSIDGSDSFDIAHVLRDKKVPFIFATGHGSSRIVPELAEYPVLQKPYFIDDLSKALGDLAPLREIAQPSG